MSYEAKAQASPITREQIDKWRIEHEELRENMAATGSDYEYIAEQAFNLGLEKAREELRAERGPNDEVGA